MTILMIYSKKWRSLLYFDRFTKCLLCPFWENLTEHLARSPWEKTMLNPPLLLDHALHGFWVRRIVRAPWWSQCTGRCHRPLQRYKDSSSLFPTYPTYEELPLSITITDWPFESICPHTYFLYLRYSAPWLQYPALFIIFRDEQESWIKSLWRIRCPETTEVFPSQGYSFIGSIIWEMSLCKVRVNYLSWEW